MLSDASSDPHMPMNERLPNDAQAFALSLRLTNRAARSAVQLLSAEAGDQLLEDADLRDEAETLLHSLFGDGQGGLYRFHLQNGGQGREGDVMVNLWLTPDGEDTANAVALRRMKDWPLVLMGTSQPRRYGESGTDFLVIDLVALPPWSVDGVPDAVPSQIAFDWGGRFASGIPATVHTVLQRLPVHRLQRNRVRLLLDDWGRFMRVRQRIAEAGRFALDYTGYRLDDAGRRARFQVAPPEDFDPSKVRQAKGDDIHLDLTPEDERIEQALAEARGRGEPERDGPGEVLGEIRQLQSNWLEIRLDAQVAAQIRSGRRVLPKKGRLEYRAIGELAQVRRLRWGLESLLRGRVTNRRLGEFLFDPNEAALPESDQAIKLAPEDLLQPHLNAGQLRAVEGALSAPDLYLIQGPPGTGKTTVIAEICYQVAKRGGRTMVASQANLAVDNAMSKLVHDPSIRALRRGRAESVEEEGQPYLEDYVIGTWLDKIGTDCRGDLEARRQRVADLSGYLALQPAIEAFESVRARYGSEIRDKRTAAVDAEEAHDAAREAFADAQLRHDALEGLLTLLSDTAAADLSPEGRVSDRDDPGDANDTDAWVGLPAELAGPEDGTRWSPPSSSAVASPAAALTGLALVKPAELQPLWDLETALALWTGEVPSDGSSGGATLTLDAVDAHFFVDYLARSRAAREAVTYIESRYAEAQPKGDALGLLCRSWFELLAREAPLLARRRARLEAPAARRARIDALRQQVAQADADLTALQGLVGEMNEIHRGLISWLRRRATADGTVDSLPPAFQSATRRELWEAAVGDQRLPTFRGIAAKARASRDASDALGQMVAQIETCVARLRSQVGSRLLAAAERQPPDWRETGLAELVSPGPDGLLWPAEDAVRALRPYLRTTMTRALAADPAARIPERRIAANLVGLRRMAEELRESQSRLSQLGETQLQELTSVVNRLAAGLSANLRAHLLGAQRAQSAALETMRQQLADLQQEVRQEEQGRGDEDQELRLLDGEKERLAQAIRGGLELTRGGELVPFQHVESVALDALSADVDDWEARWEGARTDLATARDGVRDAAAALDPEATLSLWQGRVDVALQRAAGQLKDAEAAVVAAAAARQQADGAVATLEETHRAAREVWLEAYEDLPEALRPETKSPTSSATLDQLREQCARWESERTEIQDYLAAYADFISDWIDRVTTRNAQDEADLRQIYIDNANVIGITCVQAGSRGFSQRYRNFDTVIIDEVSKATPPELLLPMLKGAKVVLVGDSRQLPPMVGPEALQDLAASLEIETRDLSHLERSLFRDLFERCPVALKSWLTDQYRMHPQIMDGINQFYHDKLACRIPEPDVARAHGLGPLIPKDTHIAWVPTDWAPAFYESRVGTSRRNDKEVEIIANLVARMDEVWETNAPAERRKEIGVITFYAAQEQALRARLLGRGGSQRFDHLDLRLGTVDRFQGMEKPIIIVSLVCNNARRDIGFARELERINVAFSRAQELLVIVGSRELFCRRASAARAAERYERVAQVVQSHGGMLNVTDFIAR